MTLYWYMHWFWITYHLYACYCHGETIHSTLTEISKNVTLNNNCSYSSKEISNATTFNIPPKYVNSSSMTLNFTTTSESTVMKTSKTKKIIKQNFTRKGVLSSTNKRMPVIDDDTKIDNSNSSNQTTINVYNQTENITFSKDELFNQSFLHNYEQIKKDGDVPVISAAGIVGITLGCITIIASVIFISFLVYRNRGLNRPQVLNDHCSNLDSSGYIDDASIRDNSEEMYSLDNDSFLNSLEAMTIQNYWTDTVKHTKL